MKIHHHILQAMLIGILPLLVACKDFLDIKPYDRVIPDTPEDYAALVNNICQGIDDGKVEAEPVLGYYNDTGAFECISDNMEVNLSEPGSPLSTYIGDLLNGRQAKYTNLYAQIRNANIIIEHFKHDKPTQEVKDLLAFSYALRGACYYQLLRQFCPPPLAPDATLGVPLVTEFNMEARPLRSTIQETINQIESDFKKSMEYDLQQPLYLFTPDAVQALLARLYFWCGRWESARKEALPLLEKYPILEGSEYKAMVDQQFGLRGNRILMADRLTGNATFISGLRSHLLTRPISVRYINLFPEKQRDIRYRYFWNKKRKSQKTLFSGIRSDEMAFIAMESAYHLGLTQQALDELNAYRQKRILGNVPYTVETLPEVNTSELVKVDATGKPLTPLIQAILNERRKEFFLENGDRWYELKRNGRPEWWVKNKGLKYWTRQYMYTYPIPVTDVELTPGLVQNPGYEETY